MFSLYRRHEKRTKKSPGCQYYKKGVRHIKCKCPVWMDGFDEHGKRQRRSLKTRSWSQAQARLTEIESGRIAVPEPAPKAVQSLASAIASFLADCATRRLRPSTIVSYKNTLGHLAAFFGKSLADVTLEKLTTFRAARKVSAASANKEIQTLRAFLNFATARRWIEENPAALLKGPKADAAPTLPFTSDEVAKIIEACGRIDNPNKREIPRARLRARAFVLTLLYSGFRISDAVKLRRDAVNKKTGQLHVRVMKTGQPLYIRLPRVALKALDALPAESEYYFWSGRAKLSTAVGSARRTIDCVTDLAGVKDVHPHRFRDTFSVELLKNGTDLRTVQLLLGHTSIRTTEKHYAPFVESMQKMLDDALKTLKFT